MTASSHRRRTIRRGARRAIPALVIIAAAVAAPAGVQAQGSVGTQGFGYPTGQLSTRARGSGGSVSPFDAESPLNPAALTATGETVLHAQYEPEFRTVSAGGATERTTFSRFPLILAAIPMGRRTALGLSASTYLDRSFSTTASGQTVFSDTTFATRQSRRSVGGVTDVRVAAARALSPRLSVGLGVHGYTGENRVSVSFSDDSAQFITFEDSVRISYGGIAASAGANWRAVKNLSLGLAYKRGGDLTVRDDASDQDLGEARVPNQLTGGLLYDGIRGTVLAASFGWTGWSSLDEAASARVQTRDAREVAFGADAVGPRFGGGAVALRAGLSWRELPFGTAGTEDPTELALSVGAGLPLAANRATLDLAAQRARRTAGDARETGWVLSHGLAVRP
jgi:hypothetical protein